MRAVVFNGPGDVSVESVPDPSLTGPDGIIVTVEKTAICGSDLHLYHGDMGVPGVHLGHEFVGEVAEIGAGVTRHKVGDRVLVSGVVGCGTCSECIAGWPMRCLNGGSGVFGTSLELPGGQAEAVAVPTADAFALTIPESMTSTQAVLLTDILPTGYIGARRADIQPGSTVAVIGQGPVGRFALQSAQLYGPATIYVVDPVPERRAGAEALGAIGIDPNDGGTVEQLLAATGGRGVDSVIEAVGADATINDAIMSVKPGGTVSVVGVNMSLEFPFPMGLAMFKGITFRICVADIPSTWSQLVPLVEVGHIRPEEVFTHHMDLDDAAEAYRIFNAREDGCLKVCLEP